MGDRKLEARAWKSLGLLSLALGNHRQAWQEQRKAWTLARVEADLELQARICANLGNLTRLDEALEEALKYHQQDLDLSTQVDSWVGQRRAHLNLSLVYAELQSGGRSQPQMKQKQVYHAEEAKVRFPQAQARDRLVHKDNVVGNILYQGTKTWQLISQL